MTAFEKLSPEVQQRIIDAAASAFAQEGYHYAGIAEICRLAGISNGALYKYFRNKEAIFFAVLDSSIQLVEEIYKNNFVSDAPLFDCIRSFLYDLVEYSRTHEEYTRIYCDLGSSSMNRFASEAAQRFKNASSIYTISMVKRCKLRGEISSRVSYDIAAYMIDSFITFFSYSLVSDYQHNRYQAFFPPKEGSDTVDGMIENIIKSLQQALQ